MQPLRPLTKRETQVVAGLCGGHTNKEIANSLGIGEKAIKAHVTAILLKLGCTNRTQAVLKMLQKDQL